MPNEPQPQQPGSINPAQPAAPGTTPVQPVQNAPQQVQPVQPVIQVQQQPVIQPVQPVQTMQPVQQAVQQAVPQAQPRPQPVPQVQLQPQPAPVYRPAPAQFQPQPQPQFQAQPQMQRPVPGMPLRPGQQPLKPGMATRKPPNPKKLIFGCTGCFGASLLIFIIFVLIFVSQTSANGENPMARSLNVDTGSFINSLITIVNLVFLAIEVVMFLLVTVGLFRFFMARKDDKDAKKRGLTLAGITFLLLAVIGGMWIGIYMFMASKRVTVARVNTVIGIITEPKVTTGLTAPVEIKFDASNLPTDTRKYNILTYLWNFGDGQSSGVPVVTHTYKNKGQNNGRYDVTLSVTKQDKTTKEETTDTYTVQVTIANVKLDAVISATPETGPAPLEVSFDASGSSAPAGEIKDYEWDFNNDNIFTDASGVKVTHTFEQLGDYKVNLRITDNTGQFDIVTMDIVVAAPNIPTAVIEIPTENGKYLVGKQYSFQAEKSTSPNGTVEKYEWTFGDGSNKATTRTATHTYKTAGTYEVTLKVTDDKGDTGESSQKIALEVAESAPIAVITTVPGPAKPDDDFISGTIPFEVAFDASKSTDPDNNIIDYKWDFDGDGTEDDTGKNVSYAYKNEGVYNATLTVIDAENNESKSTIVVKVGAQPLTARITATPVEGVWPLEVTFDASGSSYPAGKIGGYEWDFGDGTKRSDVSKLVYKYTTTGTFKAKVTAIADDKSRATAEMIIIVRPVSLTACFTPSAESGPAPLVVVFDPLCSRGTISKYSWDFGDGETKRDRKPSHRYATPGSYQVTLEVSDNQNVINTYTKTILVTGSI